MQTKALAPEYQGALTRMSVNASLTDVLAEGVRHLKQAERSGSQEEVARAGLAVAEAHRRLGQVAEADRAWKASYRAARSAGNTGAMAWALWSGGTLARQRGSLRLAFRLLGLAAEAGKRGGDVVARGYSLAGLAETGRIQGDYATVATLHEQLLAEARARGEARHTVWALEGIAQIHRNTGSLDSALEMFEEAAELAGAADDRRGRAWALRGIADIVSLRDGATARALGLLSEAEATCREMNLSGALAYNHKMRANVLFRAGRYAEAREVYEQALGEFRAMDEPRGEALASLGLVKARARLGRDRDATAADLDELRGRLDRIGLLNAREMVEKAYAELGVEPASPEHSVPAPADAPGAETASAGAGDGRR
ncbi:tetratricopeptide repeat protein [Streptomyces californicus]|uniref:tetratricopeptide repeat protein n=1 Tax=Streptomyces californicus TaxID=67351 RepID=UPI0033FA9DD9